MGLRRAIRRQYFGSRIGRKLYHWHLEDRIARHSRALSPLFLRDPAAPDAILLVACMRDEMVRLPDFFRHYRELGVDRFVLIDTGSQDDSMRWVVEQPDADLWQSSGSYEKARCGMMWISSIIRRYGLGRWCLYVDIDEHLVYDGCERHDLRDLAAKLESYGQWTLPAFMLDMYSDKSVMETHYEPPQRLLDVCPFFDAHYSTARDDPANIELGRGKIRYIGGPRYRMYADGLLPGIPHAPSLAKVPFVKWTAGVVYPRAHHIYPLEGNFAVMRGALLHFKLISDLYSKSLWAIGHKQHANGSRDYKSYRFALERQPDLRLIYEGSRRYERSASLVESGLITSLQWAPTDARATVSAGL